MRFRLGGDGITDFTGSKPHLDLEVGKAGLPVSLRYSRSRSTITARSSPSCLKPTNGENKPSKCPCWDGQGR